MRVLISGASGLIGSELASRLESHGHEVVRLSRRPPSDEHSDIQWQPDQGVLDGEQLEGFDTVVHLAGENIAGGRWNTRQKAKIRDSRVQGTKLLAETLAARQNKPQTLVTASAIGYYGDRGDEELDETSPPGTGFLAEVCHDWEAATGPSKESGIRVVHVRFGMVLSMQGGALQQMITPFKFGLGGVVGSGRQWWSWIALEDVAGSIEHAIDQGELEGPVNGTSPNPVTNREFTKTLGRAMNRPTVLPLPAFAARLVLGEMADELLLASARVFPRKLQESGYEFRYPELQEALRSLVNGGT